MLSSAEVDTGHPGWPLGFYRMAVPVLFEEIPGIPLERKGYGSLGEHFPEYPTLPLS